MIPYGKQDIDKDDINEVINVLKSEYITQGPKIKEFENSLANYCGSKYAVVFNSGTSALHGAYFVSGLKRGDEFITSPITFTATSNAGLYLGAKPIFSDVEPDTGNIDCDKIEEKISNKTKLITPVHYSGHPVDLEKIIHLAKKHNLYVIEDACHALGAKYNDYKIGNCHFSDMTVFSFHPVKHITTGEGGAILTNNLEFYEKLCAFRNHGIVKQKLKNQSHGDWYYEMQHLGFNYRMTDIQAALGISQLKKIDKFVERRRELAKQYNKVLADNSYFNIPREKDYAYSSYHLFPIQLKDKFKKRKKLIFTKMREKGLGVQVHYIPVYWHPYYQELGYKKGICPTSEDFYQREISIPLYPSITSQDVNYVIKTIFDIIKSYE